MDIQVLIRKLVSYGVQTGLVPEEDVIYTCLLYTSDAADE